MGGLAMVGLLALAVPQPALSEAPLRRISIAEGPREHRLIQKGPVAAHVVVTQAPHPRLVVAFPAGNSGAGLFLDPKEVSGLELVGPVEPWEGERGQHGVELRLRVRSATRRVRIEPLLDSVRALRDR